MAKYFIQDETLTNLADEIRVLSGTEDTLTPIQMTSNVQTANDEVDAQSALISQIQAAVNGLPEAKEDPIYQEKTVTPSDSVQVVTADSGYDALSKVTVNAAAPGGDVYIGALSIDGISPITSDAIIEEINYLLVDTAPF